MLEHYKTLGVLPDATAERIKHAYRRLARKYHPDVSKEEDAHEKFQKVQRAYDVLSDPDWRKHYDEKGTDAREDADVAARDLLATVLKQTLIRSIDVPWVSMTNVANLILDEMQDQINKQLHGCQSLLKKIDKHSGRMRTKEGILNMHEEIVHAERARAQAMAERHPGMLATIKAARLLLKDYESEAQQQPIEERSFMQRLYDGD